MNKVFEQISRIPNVLAAAFVRDDGVLSGWCANSAISPESLTFIGQTCQVILSANRAEQRVAHTGAVAFKERTLVFRDGELGLFLIYLDSPINDAVLDWLFAQIEPLLKTEGLELISK